MKKWISVIFLPLLLLSNVLTANIVKTNELHDVESAITPKSLVLLNLAEVLLDTKTSLGTQAWRKYIRSRVSSRTHDELTRLVFEKIPPKTPEPGTAQFVKELQKKGFYVFGFTSRGRNEWYATKIKDIDLLTERVLLQLDIDFERTTPPLEWAKLNAILPDYYHNGIIYSTNTYDKGEMLTLIFEKIGYRPEKVVFVDDKADSLKEVETAMKTLNIPFAGFNYDRTAKEHAQFDPMIANIQLDYLISRGTVLSDVEAKQIKDQQFANTDPDAYFEKVISKWRSKAL